MNSKRLLSSGSALVLLLALLASLALAQGPVDSPSSPQAATPAGSAFTYQGRLDSDGTPYTGACDLTFALWDAVSGGAQIGSTQTKNAVTLADGYFTVQLDFGAGAFQGDARWLEIAVRCPADAGDYTPLTPRQALTPAPYALALPGLRTEQNATSPNVIGGYAGNSVASGVVGATIGGGGDPTGGGGGQGNTANGWEATVGGGRIHTASSGLTSVGGVDDSDRPNQVLADFATVGGGSANTASGGYATVGGGAFNSASGDYSTVGGGSGNIASGFLAAVGGGSGNTASIYYATVGGGSHNTASSYYATVGGGLGNTASGHSATIPGGSDNEATGRRSFAAGSWAQALHDGAFVWADCGDHCDQSSGPPLSSTADNQFLIRAEGGVGIGLTDPSTQLDVNGNVRIRNGWRGLQIDGANDAPHDYHLIVGCLGGGADCDDDPGGNEAPGEGGFAIYDNTAAAYRLAISRDGNVGIGATHPRGALHILLAGEPPLGLSSSENGLLLGTAGTASYKWIQSYGGDLSLNPMGNHVGIGTATPVDKLEVKDGNIRVTNGSFIDDGTTLSVPDYVFEAGYAPVSLAELQAYIAREHHLPNIPSVAEIQAQGLNLGQFQMKLLEKVEELTLYTLAQQEEIDALHEQNAGLEARLSALERRAGVAGPLSPSASGSWLLPGVGLLAVGLVLVVRRGGQR